MTVDSKAELYLVIRVPTTGPRALIAAPNEFTTEAEARQRIASIESEHKMQHHTHLEVFFLQRRQDRSPKESRHHLLKLRAASQTPS